MSFSNPIYFVEGRTIVPQIIIKANIGWPLMTDVTVRFYTSSFSSTTSYYLDPVESVFSQNGQNDIFCPPCFSFNHPVERWGLQELHLHVGSLKTTVGMKDFLKIGHIGRSVLLDVPGGPPFRPYPSHSIGEAPVERNQQPAPPHQHMSESHWKCTP